MKRKLTDFKQIYHHCNQVKKETKNFELTLTEAPEGTLSTIWSIPFQPFTTSNSEFLSKFVAGWPILSLETPKKGTRNRNLNSLGAKNKKKKLPPTERPHTNYQHYSKLSPSSSWDLSNTLTTHTLFSCDQVYFPWLEKPFLPFLSSLSLSFSNTHTQIREKKNAGSWNLKAIETLKDFSLSLDFTKHAISQLDSYF